jgi:hypothetical protein
MIFLGATSLATGPQRIDETSASCTVTPFAKRTGRHDRWHDFVQPEFDVGNAGMCFV